MIGVHQNGWKMIPCFIHAENINNFIMQAENIWKKTFNLPKCIFLKKIIQCRGVESILILHFQIWHLNVVIDKFQHFEKKNKRKIWINLFFHLLMFSLSLGNGFYYDKIWQPKKWACMWRALNNFFLKILHKVSIFPGTKKGSQITIFKQCISSQQLVAKI
jgi:hypothetical protein